MLGRLSSPVRGAASCPACGSARPARRGPGRRTQVQISAARLEEFVQAELNVFARRARRPLQPLKLLEILRASSSLEKVAELVHEELPVRFARRVKHIERVEGWTEIPQLVSLHGMHVKSFRELRLADPSDTSQFPEAIDRVRQRHKRIAPLFAEALKRIDDVLIGEPRVGEAVEQVDGRDARDRQAVEDWAETFFRSRVSTELLMSHYVACVGASQNDGDHGSGSTKVGIIDTRCDPWEICQQAVAQIQEGLWPCRIETESPSESVLFCHAPRYLFYIMKELLANSARATAESAGSRDESELEPIRVTLCSDEHQVVIRISDRGGGMPSNRAKQMWSYTFSTSRSGLEGGGGGGGGATYAGDGQGISAPLFVPPERQGGAENDGG
mmetsp:Transcript_84156/g.265659  ORF Transcript_84156/g.265659 Transcript_84156/m.265659 type:complete len:386 (-) Transcript_84156:79-1236(-)